MPKFRKKPVEIEAWQYTGEMAGELRGVCQCELGRHVPHVHTMHDGQLARLTAGDWIIPEPVPDRYYPCKPDVFAKTYDPI